MSARLPLSLLVALSCVSACVNQPGPAGVRGSRAPLLVSPSPGGGPAPQASATARPPASVIGTATLQKPSSPTTLVSGVIRIDAAYVESARLGKVLSQNGTTAVTSNGLIGQDGAGIISGGAGNIIANDGASIIANDGASILANDGASIISGGAGNIISGGAGNYGLLQTAVARPAGESHPAAGMLIRVIGLQDNRALPLGVDAAGKPIYAVYTNRQGGYELYLAAGIEQNVRIVASFPEISDTRLTYNFVTAPAQAQNQQHGETSALVSRYVRQVLVSQMSALLADQDVKNLASPKPEGDYDVDQSFTLPVSRDGLDVLIKEYAVRSKALGIASLAPHQRDFISQRIADTVVGATGDLSQVRVVTGTKDWSGPDEFSLDALTKLFDAILSATARRLDAGRAAGDSAPFAKLPYMIDANAQRAARGLPPYQILKPADMGDLIVQQYFANGEIRQSRKFQLVLEDLGLPIREFEHMRAAFDGLYVALAVPLSTDEAVKQATFKAMEEAVPVARNLALPPGSVSPGPLPVPARELGAVATFAGTGSPDALLGPALSAAFNEPQAVAFDEAGQLYVSDTLNDRVCKIDMTAPDHPVTVVAALEAPRDMAIHGGSLYVSSAEAHKLFKVDLATQAVTTLSGEAGPGFLDGPAATARFKFPGGLAVDKSGDLYVADAQNFRVRKISLSEPGQPVSTYAGNAVQDVTGGPRLSATFLAPRALAFDPMGRLVIVDGGDSRVRLVRADGSVMSVAGSGHHGHGDGYWSNAEFHGMAAMALDPKNGGLVVADDRNQLIRRVRFVADDAAVASTVAGQWIPFVPLNPDDPYFGQPGFADGDGLKARFDTPTGIAVAADGRIYVADKKNHRIRVITPR